jgi:hypothetical protein
MRTFVLSLAIGCVMASAAIAAEAGNSPAACTEVQTCGSPNCCAHCGCCCKCEKHCQLVCETKEVKKSVWVVHCQDFCAPLPGCGHNGCCDCEACQAARACEAQATCCEGGNGKCNPCAKEENKRLVPPKCGKVREKKTLEKKEVVCKVPSYKCIVVYCCPQCGAQQCQGAEPQPAPATPAAPTMAPPAPMPMKTTLLPPAPPVGDMSMAR